MNVYRHSVVVVGLVASSCTGSKIWQLSGQKSLIFLYPT